MHAAPARFYDWCGRRSRVKDRFYCCVTCCWGARGEVHRAAEVVELFSDCRDMISINVSSGRTSRENIIFDKANRVPVSGAVWDETEAGRRNKPS